MFTTPILGDHLYKEQQRDDVYQVCPLCIISTMNDAEDYAGLDNDGVVVSVQLSSVQWLEKNMAGGSPESL